MAELPSSPGILDVITYKGDTLGTPSQEGIQITLTSGGSPVDLTGATILAQVKKRKESSNAILEFLTGTADVVETDLSNGVFTLKKTATQMDVKAFDDYYWDLQVTFPGGQNITYLQGSWTNRQDVAR